MNTTEEWNNIAKERLLDRIAGNDVSYNNVLLPIIIDNIKSNIINRKYTKLIIIFVTESDSYFTVNMLCMKVQ